MLFEVLADETLDVSLRGLALGNSLVKMLLERLVMIVEVELQGDAPDFIAIVGAGYAVGRFNRHSCNPLGNTEWA